MELDIEIAMEVSDQIAKASDSKNSSSPRGGVKGMMARRKAARKTSQGAQISDSEAINMLSMLDKN